MKVISRTKFNRAPGQTLDYALADGVIVESFGRPSSRVVMISQQRYNELMADRRKAKILEADHSAMMQAVKQLNQH